MQLIFSEEVKIKYGLFKKEHLELQKYKSFIEASAKKDDTDKKSDTSISKDLLEYGEHVQEKISDLHQRIIYKVIKLCYILNDDELDDISIEEYDSCIKEINSRRPDIFKFFLITIG